MGPDFLERASYTLPFWMPEFSAALGKKEKKTKILVSWLLHLSNMNYVKLQVCCENQLRCHMSVVLNLRLTLGWGPRI